MPIHIHYIADGGVVLKATGRLLSAEIGEANAKLYETPEKIRAITYQLWDMTNLEGYDADIEGVRRVIAQDQQATEINPKMLMAVVGDRNVLFGLARIWETEMGLDERPARVFRRLEEAERWIEESLKGVLKEN